MSKKIIKKSLLVLSGIAILLTTVLVVHIYMVTRDSDDGYFQGIMMSRIDFQQQINSSEAKEIRQFVNEIDGVQKSYFNDKDNILVFSYRADKIKPEIVYKAVMDRWSYDARRYIAANTGNGCPVIDKDSFTYKAGAFIQGLFK